MEMNCLSRKIIFQVSAPSWGAGFSQLRLESKPLLRVLLSPGQVKPNNLS